MVANATKPKPERFVSLLDAHFKVALQVHFSPPFSKEVQELLQAYVSMGLAHERTDKGQYQIFVRPEMQDEHSLAEILGGKTHIILFPGAFSGYNVRALSAEEKLVFRRKAHPHTGSPTLWMMAARRSEEGCFTAFSSREVGSGNPNYVTLLFSSKVKPDFPGFEAVYLKAYLDGMYKYFLVEARDLYPDIQVTIRSVPQDTVQPSLRFETQ